MIWKTYKYLYYRLYIWYRKKYGDSDLPEYSVIMVMSLNIMCNFASLVIIISIIKDVMIIPMNVSKTWALLPLFILLIIHYFAFIHRGKYRKIEKEFKKERKKERVWKGWLVLLYTVGSPVFYIFLGFFGIWIKH